MAEHVATAIVYHHERKVAQTTVVRKQRLGVIGGKTHDDATLTRMFDAMQALKEEVATLGVFTLPPPLAPYVSFLPADMDVVPYIKCALAQNNASAPVTCDFATNLFTETYIHSNSNT